jgi:hypothetical protein
VTGGHYNLYHATRTVKLDLTRTPQHVRPRVRIEDDAIPRERAEVPMHHACVISGHDDRTLPILHNDGGRQIMRHDNVRATDNLLTQLHGTQTRDAPVVAVRVRKGLRTVREAGINVGGEHGVRHGSDLAVPHRVVPTERHLGPASPKEPELSDRLLHSRSPNWEAPLDHLPHVRQPLGDDILLHRFAFRRPAARNPKVVSRAIARPADLDGHGLVSERVVLVPLLVEILEGARHARKLLEEACILCTIQFEEAAARVVTPQA